MKRLEWLLAPMIMAGMLALHGCGFVSGTGVTGPQFNSAPGSISSTSFERAENVPAGKAMVYIYRPADPSGEDAPVPFGVKVSGKAVTMLFQGGYYPYLAEPGQIEFTAFDTGLIVSHATFSVTVDAKAGRVYYIKGSHGKGFAGKARLESVSPETGADEILSCKLIK